MFPEDATCSNLTENVFREFCILLQNNETVSILMLYIIFDIFGKMCNFFGGGPLGKIGTFFNNCSSLFVVKCQVLNLTCKIWRQGFFKYSPGVHYINLTENCG